MREQLLKTFQRVFRPKSWIIKLDGHIVRLYDGKFTFKSKKSALTHLAIHFDAHATYEVIKSKPDVKKGVRILRSLLAEKVLTIEKI